MLRATLAVSIVLLIFQISASASEHTAAERARQAKKQKESHAAKIHKTYRPEFHGMGDGQDYSSYEECRAEVLNLMIGCD